MKKVAKTAPAKKIASSSSVDLEETALAKFNTGRYREAIECYKVLLKQTKHPNPKWQPKLADCYLLRSLSLAEKGMLKEAVVLWENYSQNAAPPYQALDSYIIWQLQNNQSAKVRTALSQIPAQHLDQDYSELAAFLGLIMLTGSSEVATLLPQGCQLLKHFEFAREALDAYRKQEPDAIDEALAKLPFRSAFRDFRTLMKALLLLPKSIEQANSLLTKIPPASPYQSLVRLIQALPAQGADSVKKLMALDPKQRKLLSAAKGFTKKQEELLNALCQQKELTDKIKFGLAIRYRDLFGANLSERFCQATLADYPAGQRDFNKAFNVRDGFQSQRLKALNAEHKGDHQTAENCWLQAIDALKAHLNPENAFKIALILRHMTAFGPKKDPSLWIDSLEYDPDDRESYLKIARIYEQKGLRNNSFKEWLDKGLAKFPGDLDFLMLAIQEALSKNAFKKAAQYAKNILKTDPLNTYAKQTLFRCHLAHARKLLLSKKDHLIENELKQAQSLNLGKRHQSLIELMRGFWLYSSTDAAAGIQLISASALKIDNCPANAQFVVAVEASFLKVPLAPLLRKLTPIPKKYLLTAQELMRLIDHIQHAIKDDDDNRSHTAEAVAVIQAVLKASIKEQAYREDELLALCQCFETLKQFDLLLHTAKIARAKSDKPIWLYYQAYAAAKGVAKNSTRATIDSLEDYLDRHGKAMFNERATQLIGEFLDNYYKAHAPAFGYKGLGPFQGSMEEELDDDMDAMEDLFDHLSPAVIKKIMAKMSALTAAMGPDKLLPLLEKKYLPKKVNILLAIMEEPDLLPALLFLKAAEDLGIDTQISIEEVLDYFSLDETGNSPNFPFF